MMQVDGSANTTEEECKEEPTIRKLRGRNVKSQSTTKNSKPLNRSKRVMTVNADAPRYPPLNITVTASPKSTKKSEPMPRKLTPFEGSILERQSHGVAQSCGTSSSLPTGKNLDQATRKLNFCDLTSTIVEEKIECKYKSEVPIRNEKLRSIPLPLTKNLHEPATGCLKSFQFKHCETIQYKLEIAPPKGISTDREDISILKICDDPNESITNKFTNNNMESCPESSNQVQTALSDANMELQERLSAEEEDIPLIEKSPIEVTQKFIDKLNKQISQDEVSNHSEELFSPHSLTPLDIIERQFPSEKPETTFQFSSSLEELITPYQENQPKDQTGTCLAYQSPKIVSQSELEKLSNKTNLREERTHIPENVTKAEEYDHKKNVLQQAGTSHCRGLTKTTKIESKQDLVKTPKIIELHNVDNIKNQSINLQSLTSYLEISKLHEMDTLSLNVNKTQTFMKYMTPKFKPPSGTLIRETLSLYNIPMERNQDPFYSDITHVTGAVDVGHNTLRILGKYQHEEFQSSFATLAQFQKETSDAKSHKQLKTLKLSYCTNESCFMQPVKKPPSLKEVKLWLLKDKAKLKKPLIDDEAPEVDEGKSCKEVQDCDTTEMLGLTNSGKTQESVVFSSTLNKSSWGNSHAISGVSLNNTHGFKMTLENLQEARSLDIYQYITSLVMELHVETRGALCPDPQIDPVQVIFFALANDVPDVEVNSGRTLGLGLELSAIGLQGFKLSGSTAEESNKTLSKEAVVSQTENDKMKTKLTCSSEFLSSIDPSEKFLRGFICVSPHFPDNNILSGTGITSTKYTFVVPDEQSLFEKFLELFHLWNPDILMGYEIEQASWGYFVERGYVVGMNIPSLLSRIKNEKKITATADEHQEELHSHLKITGRIVLDLWRILKHEIALQSYTFENLAYHVLHERLPHYSFKELTLWWNHMNPKYRHRTIMYYLHRVEGAFRLIDHYDLIGRTSELARLFGITFYEVLSRGSQFRVESMMLRLAKPYEYIPVSPSVQQRAQMKAPEFLPLILEPESKFYKDPVIVLDFQSLYPSIIIAYNYCFSTCLGRIEHLASDAVFEFGAYELEVSRKLIAKYLTTNMLTISPCGVAFVKEQIRPGIMPRMLREILDTRLMVKESMKKHKANKTLQKVLHSRQLGLKLIANVTYGYTAANFSGRMPACEIADSVVSKGRETLQCAIAMVETHPTWSARVVYGDTDSMFVLCVGKTREEAFKIGEEIAESVTNANPSPIKLKLEKVYQPCILQTKKRYVGYMYESKDQKKPEFEAKGIETVRRDGCPAASKMLEKCLRLLFEKRDVSEVRNYVLKQFHKILTGRVSIQDLTFAKEYRGKEGYRPGACVPALELTRKWIVQDKRKEPRSGERVPYVIVNGPPGLSLIKLVKSPQDLLEDPNLRPNALYYITKAIIPPINRCFKLIGANLFNWFNEMPRKQVQYLHAGSPNKGPKSTISQYFATAACASCGDQTKDGLCPSCLQNSQLTIANLYKKMSAWERNYFNCKKICESCCERPTDLKCNSLDCPVLYRRKQTTHDLQQTEFVRSLLDKFPEPKDKMALLF